MKELSESYCLVGMLEESKGERSLSIIVYLDLKIPKLSRNVNYE